MRRFIEGTDRTQGTLFPDYLDDWVDENNPVQVIDAFVDELDLGELGFDGVTPEATGRPSYHPSVLLKLYIYGYLNRVQSSRRLEREASRNVELMWLTGRLVPDHKTIADFRKDNGAAIRAVCGRFIVLCRALDVFGEASSFAASCGVNSPALMTWRARRRRRSFLGVLTRPIPSESVPVCGARLGRHASMEGSMKRFATFDQPKRFVQVLFTLLGICYSGVY
jgi:transposase